MLKYLFTAYYSDGTLLQQTQEDVSQQDPSRSAFFDVDQSRLTKFSLASSANGDPHCYTLNLATGVFTVDGVPFRLHEDGELPSGSVLRLIFFRRHTYHVNASLGSVSEQVVYRLGWQTNDAEGRNIQRVMEFD